MGDWITSTVESLGYFGIVLLMCLENVVPPVPSELIMPLAGFLAERGEMVLALVILAGTIGSVLGALPLYGLGRWLGEERLARWIDRKGHWLAVSPGDFEKSKQWFNRHSGAAVLLCRLVPGVRSLISIPAGIHRMSLPMFLLYTAIGTGMWAAVLAWLGSLLGENYERVEHWLSPVAYVVLGGIVLSFIARVIVLRRRRNQRRAARSA